MILNLTQHKATPEQIAQGVVDLPEESRAELARLLTFEDLPEASLMELRAAEIARSIKSGSWGGATASRVMIGGAPFFMPYLTEALKRHGIHAVYAFSVRESAEKVVDGKTIKSSVFKHVGFVEAV